MTNSTKRAPFMRPKEDKRPLPGAETPRRVVLEYVRAHQDCTTYDVAKAINQDIRHTAKYLQALLADEWLWQGPPRDGDVYSTWRYREWAKDLDATPEKAKQL